MPPTYQPSSSRVCVELTLVEAYPVCHGAPPVMTVPIFKILLLEPEFADLERAGANPCTIRRGPTTLTSNIAVNLSGSVSRAAEAPVTPAYSLAHRSG